MRSFILLLCLIPTIICAQNLSLEDQLKQAVLPWIWLTTISIN